MRTRRLRTAAAATLAAAAVAGPASAQAATTSAQTVLDWNDTAVSTLAASGKPVTESLIYVGLTQAAVYDAVNAIEGGFEPYRIRPGVPPHASAESAAAAAAYGVLVNYFPAQKPALDAAYAASLTKIPDGAAEDRGVLVGQQVASGIVASRIDDGRDAPPPSIPDPAPGVWRPTPPGFLAPQTPWVANVTPLLLRRASQFRPGPPPRLGSRLYERDLQETRLYGAKTGSLRAPEQTETALFYTDNAVQMDNRALRSLVARQGLDLEGAARALALGNTVLADAATACLEAKYAYWFWRPVTAITLTRDPSWEPLGITPNHPEYPAAHGCNTSALGEIAAALLSTDRIELDVSSNVTHTTHHFATVGDLQREIVNARIWAGFHYRNSGEVGVRLGETVTRWALRHYFRPVHRHLGEED
jgi:hypothetical protein